ncbi:MAG: thioredoxin domain-containing protein, partial [Saprospiraceae bacterium]
LQQVWPLVIRDGQPSFYSNWCILMLSGIKPPYEVAIVGENYKDVLSEMQKHYLPEAIFLGGKEEGSLPLLKGKLADGQTLIYVCQNKVCKMPTSEVQVALQFLTE